MKFPYSVTQQRFTLPNSAQPNTELEYFQLFFSDDVIGEIVTTTNMYAVEKNKEGESSSRILNVALVIGRNSLFNLKNRQLF
jgi:hypothetical protein